MAMGLAALGLLTFLLGCSGTFAERQKSERAAKCLLTGSWTNDLESTMEINVDKTGMFSGLYKTKVSSSGKPIPPSPLQGIQHQGHQPTFGFTVSWDVTGSTTVFVGQCLVDKNGQEQLKTIWLLRSKMEFASDDWKATLVGTNIFYRTK